MKDKYIEYNVTHVKKVDGISYGWISELDKDCIYIKKSSLLPVIIDEIKPVLKLNKLGCCYNNKHIIYTPCYIDGVWAEELRLSSYTGQLSNRHIMEVRKILTFRYILGLPSISTKSILIRNGKLYDYGDHTIKEIDSERYLSSRVYESWFEDFKMVDTLHRMIKSDGADIVDSLLKIRIKIEKTVKKIDKRYLYFVSLILDRISVTLDSKL